MRSITGFVLALLGVFLLAAVVLLRLWLVPAAAKFPLNEYEVVHLTGSGSYFSRSEVRELSGISVEATYTIKGDVADGSDSTAVWDFFTYVYDRTNHAPVTYGSDREAFDRTTGDLVHCCGEYVTIPGSSQHHSPAMTGLGPVYPMGLKPESLTMFDPTATGPERFVYAGTATADGLRLDKFIEKIAPVKIGTINVPGPIIGNSFQKEVPLPEYYSSTNVFYVDPVTGVPLDATETPTFTLGTSPSDVEILAFKASVAETKPSIASLVSQDKHGRSELTLVKVTLPLAGLLGGLAALTAGIILMWRACAAGEPFLRWLPGQRRDDDQAPGQPGGPGSAEDADPSGDTDPSDDTAPLQRSI